MQVIRVRADLRITFGHYVEVKGSLQQGKTLFNPLITTVREQFILTLQGKLITCLMKTVG